MKSRPLSAESFTANRDRLRKRLPPGSLVILNANDILPTNADGTLPLVQNSDLFYFTGVEQEETILLLAPDASDEKLREVLFLRETSEQLRIWEGDKLTREQASAVSGICSVKWLAEFPRVFRQLMCESENVFLNTNEHYRAVIEVESRDARFIRQCQAQYPLHRYHRLARLMHELRVVKSPAEIAAIRAACQITGRGFRRALKFVAPGVNEKEVEAEFAHEFIRHHAVFAYSPIVAAGVNNCVLHYVRNDQTCRKGELLLLDVAAAQQHYMSDLTRTIPVSGRFTRRQKQVYNAVLRVFRSIIKGMTPGKSLLDLRRDCEALLTEECLTLKLLKPADVRRQTAGDPAVKKYFMHGVAHPIGLDVHDVVYPAQKLQPGWVVTCEPALYVREEGFGVRLENTVHVTPDGAEDLMADIPIEADEIEALMN